jgi:rhodanese-related sulfurtransferase
VGFLRDNWWLVVIAVVSGFGVVWPSIARMMSGVPQVGVAEAVNLINRRDAVVLDVRTQGEYGAGHLVGARHVPLGDLKARMSELERFRERPVLVHCASGSRSQVAAKTLKEAGFKEVFNLQGGMGAWTQAGMPTEK